MKNHILYIVIAFSVLACQKSETSNSDSSLSSTGKGGSTARFTISGDYLFTVDRQDLHIFDVENPVDPVEMSLYNIGRDIETIFAMGDYLFIGSEIAVYIYNIEQPLQPRLIDVFRHATACDPVVADSSYAYVTLRNNGRTCGGATNELQLINITDINNAYVEFNYLMEAPYGLGVDKNYLFVCDNGIKMFDKTDPSDIQLIVKIPGIDARDVIPYKNNLIVTATNGIYQFDYSTGTLIQKNHIALN
jgi:hypothetical protein